MIPTYNGQEFLADTLINITAQSMGDRVEVVLCDDLSTDRTREIAKQFCKEHENINLYENRKNLGMDRNFEQATAHATGDYIWLCGQDDVIGEGAIDKVLSVLDGDPQIDFIYVNFGQYTHDLGNVIAEKMLEIDRDVLCENPQSFLDVTGTTRLPSFLPAFILRRSLWNSVDKTRFYGTQFVQIGVFLALLKNLRSYIIARPYVKGRIPDNGWQQNRLKVLDIFTGFLEVITYFFKNEPGLIPKRMYRKQLSFSWKNILYNVYVLKLQGVPVNRKIDDRLKRILHPGRLLIIKFFLAMPRSIASLINPVIEALVRRYKEKRGANFDA